MSRCRPCCALLLCALLLCAQSATAVVEISLSGAETPTLIHEVYVREGIPFLPLRELLPPLGLTGSWDAGKHLFRIRAGGGEVLLAPGSRFLRFGKRSVTLSQAPRFIDGELRVPEEVVADVLPRLLGLKIVYRNREATETGEQAPDDKGAAGTGFWSALRRIVIDPGHGGDDPGAISPTGDKEKAVVLAIAQRLEKLLKMEDAPVVLTRNADYAVPLSQRLVEGSGHAQENLLISLHAGAWPSSEARGCTLYLAPQRVAAGEDDDLARQLARRLVDALRDAGAAECAIESAPLLPLTASAAPAVLIELGYLTNPDDLRRLRSDDGQERIARALALGVRAHAEALQRRTMDDVPTAQ